ncbi:TonB-dependent receptor [Helicobacter aurati]|uniref:TonB-dependent receptor n=1 Tax=Helicobacter aurati TaxID=137778 RepID=A0A3D8JA44_9HELI|nr:TonB-dependent receptor [Helicobacter aurati]RDU73744.1 TonB-dependent receptor [Helicobacter aurati]
MIRYILFIALFWYELRAVIQENTTQPDTSEVNKTTQSFHEDQLRQANDEPKSYMLNAVTATTNSDTLKSKEIYQSGNSINSQILESNPSGNGDIGSILRILPNVQYDNAQLRSTTPGEIDPAKISISGGLHYQNLFTLDGRGMNNDLNPAQNGSTWTSTAPSRSQGLAIDTSLLESINVQDSNIGAAYGGFTGGIVEAITRKAKRKFGANISYQMTQGNAAPKKFSMTNYHIYGDNAALDNFVNAYSNSEGTTNSPVFIKHLVRASIESKFSDNFGFIASFATTQSFIPLRRVDNDYLNTTRYPIPAGIVQDENGQAKQTQARKIYNYFMKVHYDYSENLGFELSYTYAPDYNNRFLLGGKPGQSYDWINGGHDIGFKTIWTNALGKMTNILSYSYLESSTVIHNFEHTKYWRISDSKNWANWAGQAREGGYAPSESMQHTLSNKCIQDFKPFNVLGTLHKMQLGLELGYQHANFAYTAEYIRAQNTIKIQDSDVGKCNNEWCDSSKTYYVKQNGTRPNYYYTLETWNNGQYFHMANFYSGATMIDNTILATFAEDDIAIPIAQAMLNIRQGIRIDTDSYMGKVTFAPRFSISLEAPWNLSSDFGTTFIGGANRYYGRNIFSYRLRADLNSMLTTIYRMSPDIDFYDVLASGKMCSGSMITDSDTGIRRYNDNCLVTNQNSVKFSQLKVPYVDEFVIGFVQKFWDWSLAAKYIYREGKDDIRYTRRDYAGLPADSSYTTNYYFFTNEGKSWTNVLTITFSNDEALEFCGISNFVFFAFDWTNIKRNFNDYASAASAGELEDDWILWDDGKSAQIIRWSQRPPDNFVRPWTLRLTTIHSFHIGKIKCLWNNFFRYRAGYYAIASSGNNNIPNILAPDGTPIVQAFRAMKLPGSFTWDMRIGFEVIVYKSNTFFMNLDIFNVLDTKNVALATTNFTTAALTPTYEVGRQFWLQVGYKY